jgi:periplasmic protein TonB
VRLLRFPTAFAFALTFTALIFWGLSVLIHRSVDKAELKTATKIEFTRLRRDTDVKLRARAQKPQRVETAQVQNTPQISINLGQGPGKMEVLPPNIDTSSVLSGVSFGFGGGGGGLGGGGAAADRDVVPLVRIEPDYPARAAQRGIEGYVVVKFTISAAGTIKDATVVDAEPKGIFDSAAIEAVSRWKYKPKVEKGMAVERAGVQVRLAFQLDK